MMIEKTNKNVLWLKWHSILSLLKIMDLKYSPIRSIFTPSVQLFSVWAEFIHTVLQSSWEKISHVLDLGKKWEIFHRLRWHYYSIEFEFFASENPCSLPIYAKITISASVTREWIVNRMRCLRSLLNISIFVGNSAVLQADSSEKFTLSIDEFYCRSVDWPSGDFEADRFWENVAFPSLLKLTSTFEE